MARGNNNNREPDNNLAKNQLDNNLQPVPQPSATPSPEPPPVPEKSANLVGAAAVPVALTMVDPVITPAPVKSQARRTLQDELDDTDEQVRVCVWLHQ